MYKWLIVECQFADVPAIPAGLDTNIRRFLGLPGGGFGNMFDYIHDISYNKASWVSQFVQFVPVKFKVGDVNVNNRAQRMRECLEAVPAEQLPDLEQFYGVIVVGNAICDSGAGGIGQSSQTINGKAYNLASVFLGSHALFTGFAVEEVLHGMGLGHSYDDSQNRFGGGLGEYGDPWDAMSAGNTFAFVDNNWQTTPPPASGGPGLCVPFLLRMGWLPAANQAHFDKDGPIQEFTINALSHPQPGKPMMVHVPIGDPNPQNGEFVVEYRQADGWDQGFNQNPAALRNRPVVPRATVAQGGTVLVHRYRENGNPAATLIENPTNGANQVTQNVILKNPAGPIYVITVKSIDTKSGTATVSIGPI